MFAFLQWSGPDDCWNARSISVTSTKTMMILFCLLHSNNPDKLALKSLNFLLCSYLGDKKTKTLLQSMMSEISSA